MQYQDNHGAAQCAQSPCEEHSFVPDHSALPAQAVISLLCPIQVG